MTTWRGLFFLILITVFTLVPGNSQAQSINTIDAALQAVHRDCQRLENNIACYASGKVQASLREGTASFQQPGDVIPLETLQTLTTEATSIEDWGVSLVQLAEKSGDSLTMVLLGETEVSNTFDPAATIPECFATNLNAGKINVHARPNPQQAILAFLEPQDTLPVNGVDESNQWYRVELNNTLGWLRRENIALSCELSNLPAVSPEDVRALYQYPMQQVTFKTGADVSNEAVSGMFLYSPEGQKGQLLINDVQIDLAGAAFLKAEQNNSLTITVLQGKAAVAAQGTSVTAIQGQVTDVPLSGLAASGTPTVSEITDPGNIRDLLNSVIYGQAYNGPNSTIPGLSLSADVTGVEENDLVRVNLSFNADAAGCPVSDPRPVDVIFVLNISEEMSATQIALLRSAVAGAVDALADAGGRYGIIAFRNQAKTIAKLDEPFEGEAFEATFDSAVHAILREDQGTESAFNTGLAAALTLFKQSEPLNHPQTIIVVSAESGNLELTQPILNEVRNRNIQLISVGVGDLADAEFLTVLSDQNFVAAPGLIDLNPILHNTILGLTRSEAVSDFSLSYSFDDDFELVSGLAKDAGGTIGNNAVTWKFDTIREGQQIDMPLLLRAKTTGALSAGTVSVNYACSQDSTRITTSAVAVPFIQGSIRLGEVTTARQGVLSLAKASGAGVLRPFGQDVWALDTEANQTIAVITGGTEEPPIAVIDGSTVEPLYTLDNFDGTGRRLNVFHLAESGPHWLTLQSANADAAGQYTVTVTPDTFDSAVASLKTDGTRLNDQQENAEGRIYNLDAASGDILTLRYTGQAETVPFEVISLDGQKSVELVSRFDPRNRQWVSVQALQGAGPYRLIVKASGEYGIEAAAGDTLTNPQGKIEIGDALTQKVVNENPIVVSYEVAVPQEERVGLIISGATGEPTLLDTAGEHLESPDRIQVNSLKVSSYDLAAGIYTLYLEVRGNYGINLTTIEGDLAEAVGAFKGSLILDRPLEDNIESETPLAIYSLSPGTGKPLFEGDTLTVFLENVQDAGRNTILIRSADNVTAEITLDFSQPNQDRYISVHELRGQGPYQVFVSGQDEYRVNVIRGDLLSNDKGNLVIGQTVNDSSNAPQLLYYTLSPETGKQLLEGDVITVSFTNRGDREDPFDPPTVTDSRLNPIPVLEFFNVGRRFVGVYELQGQPPYRLVIPNIGAYSLSLNIGNNLVRDEGNIETGDEFTRTTSGPQIVEFELEGRAKQTFTVTVADPNENINSGRDLNLSIHNSAGELLPPNISYFAFNAIKSVYTLPADATYTLSFTFDGTYAIEIVEGDELTVDKGLFFLGDAEITEVDEEEEGKVLVYRLEIDTPTALSIFDLNASHTLYDPNGYQLFPGSDLLTYENRRFTGRMQIYALPNPGTYTLYVSAFSNYTLSVVPENLITVDKGNIYFGITETDKLENNLRFARYTINAQEGETISVQFSMESVQRARTELDENTLILVDANGVPISVNYSVRDNGYNFFAYELVGPAPYTLLVQPQRPGGRFDSAFEAHQEYTITVTQGNTIRVLKGAVASEIIDENPEEDGRRTVVYDYVTNAPQDLMVDLKSDRTFDSTTLRVMDANGDPVPSEASGFTQNDTVVRLFRLPAAGAYTIEFEMVGEYTLHAGTGDVMTVDFGTVFINPRNPELQPQLDANGQPVLDNDGNPVFEEYEPVTATNTLESTQIVAYYTIDAPENEIVSIFVETRDESTVTLTDANDNLVALLDSVEDRTGNIYIYQLIGTPPYRLRLDTNPGEHTVRVDEGNVLIAEMGVLPMNPANPERQPRLDANGQPEVDEQGNPVFEEYIPIVTEAELENPALVASYTIEGQAGDVITLQIDQSGSVNTEPILINGEFELLLPRDSIPNRASIMQTYELTGSPPYTLLFVPNRQYTVTLTEGDILVADAGVLPIGISEEPYTSEIAEPARIAAHTLDLFPGNLVTVQIQSGRNPVPHEVRDANGEVLTPEIRLFENGNNVSVYLTSGVGPYTLRLVPDGEYQVTTVVSNLVRVDLGFIRFDLETTGELPDPGLVATYGVDAKRDQIVTVYLQDNRRPVSGEFRDANGKLWQPDVQVEQDNGLYSVYEIGGPPPYELTFATEGEYNVRVFENNVLRAEMGNVPLGEDVEGELEAPARTAVYTIPAQPGEIISVQLQVGGRPALWRLFDANGQELTPLQATIKQNVTFGIYTLAGPTPYTLEFNADRNYTLNVSRNNVLIADRGEISMNEDLSENLEFPQEFVLYTVNRQEGQVVSVALQDGGRPAEFKLTDSEGNELEPDADVTKSNTIYRVFTLTGPAPYTISFTSTGRYNITASDGNVLRADKGVIRFGNTATDQLEDPQEAAIYVIDGVPGQIISLNLQDRNRPLSGELLDSNGQEVLPFGQAIVNNRDYRTFVLSGTPPYTYVFFPEGRYTLQLTEGNIFRAELGTVPFGGSVSNRLTAPVRIASYTIYTEADQIISIKIASRGREFVLPTLINADGETIEPLAEVYDGTSTYTGVYMLTGSAPYTIEFEPGTDQYTLTLERKNVTEVELDPIGPQAETVETED